MSHNPYSPPATALQAQPNPKRPGTVVVAAWLFAFSYAFGLTIALDQGGIPRTLLASLGLLFGLFVSAGMLLAICFRKNWARWLVVVLIALNLFVLPDLMSRSADWIKVLYAAQGLLQLASAILILAPISSPWYRPNISLKRTDQSLRD